MSVPESPHTVFPTPTAGPDPAALPTRRAAAGQPLLWMGLWLVGVAILIGGTFLPWVYSGRVAKSSYSITGSLERHLNLPGWAETVVSGWVFLGPLLAVLAATFALGPRRTAAGISVLCFVFITLLCAGVLIVGGAQNGPISVAALGPSVTLAGVLIAMIGAVALVVRKPGHTG